jgi:hypothetical protein
MDGDHRALPEKGQVKILWLVAINKSDFHFAHREPTGLPDNQAL